MTAGFVVEKILEPEPYPLTKMSEIKRKRIPYIHKDYVKELIYGKEYHLSSFSKLEKIMIDEANPKKGKLWGTSPLNRAIGIVATTTTLSGLVLQCGSFMYTVAS